MFCIAKVQASGCVTSPPFLTPPFSSGEKKPPERLNNAEGKMFFFLELAIACWGKKSEDAMQRNGWKPCRALHLVVLFLCLDGGALFAFLFHHATWALHELAASFFNHASHKQNAHTTCKLVPHGSPSKKNPSLFLKLKP